MKNYWNKLYWLGIPAIALVGLAVPVFAQDTTPPPAPPPPAATQSAPQPAPPNSGSPGAPEQTPAAASPIPAASTTPQSATPASAATIQVPAGTHIPLVLHNGISTRTARPGDPVYLETLFPIMIDGHVVIPAGSYMSGEITESKRPGRVKGRGEIAVRLKTLILPNAYMVNLNATPEGAATGGNETMDSEGKVIGGSNKAGDVGTIARTTVAGAGIGGLATRTPEGAGIGAGIGAAAGLAAVLLTRGPDAVLPRGSTLEAVLDRPIYLESDKVQFTGPGQASTLSGPPNRDHDRARVPF
jgi:hypothetical protein